MIQASVNLILYNHLSRKGGDEKGNIFGWAKEAQLLPFTHKPFRFTQTFFGGQLRIASFYLTWSGLICTELIRLRSQNKSRTPSLSCKFNYSKGLQNKQKKNK